MCRVQLQFKKGNGYIYPSISVKLQKLMPQEAGAGNSPLFKNSLASPGQTCKVLRAFPPDRNGAYRVSASAVHSTTFLPSPLRPRLSTAWPYQVRLVKFCVLSLLTETVSVQFLPAVHSTIFYPSALRPALGGRRGLG